jgi:hypothetical protein
MDFYGFEEILLDFLFLFSAVKTAIVGTTGRYSKVIFHVACQHYYN